jgi:hypothetical protein
MSQDSYQYVDKETEYKANLLIDRLSPVLSSFPELTLDYNWPSIGIIDLISFPLRKKLSMDEIETELLRLVSSYLGVWLSRTWTDAGIIHTVYTDNDLGGVCFRLQKPDSEEQKEYILENYLKNLFVDMPSDLPVLHNFRRPYTPDGNMLSSVMLGVVTGLSPLGEVWWRDASDSRDFPEVKKVERALAKQCARWFQHSNPDCLLSQVPDLFLHGVVMPPLFMERNPGINESSDMLVSYFENNKVPKEMVQELVSVFSRCPDEKIAILGISLVPYCYDCSGPLPESVISAFKHYKHIVPTLRNTLLAYLDPSISPEYVVNEMDPGSLEVFEFEKRTGTIPWLSLTKEDMAEKRSFPITDFIRAVISFDFESAYQEVQEIVIEHPADLGFRIQQIALEMVQGEYEYAHELSKVLLSEPGIEHRPDFYRLWGTCLLKLGEAEIALRYFQQALACKGLSPEFKSELLNSIAWCNIILKREDKAKPCLVEAQSLSNAPLTILLNRAYIALSENNISEHASFLSQAVSILPYDRRVFSNL